MRVKIFILFTFFCIGCGTNGFSQNPNVKPVNDISIAKLFPSDTINLFVKMIDPIELCYFSMDPINYGNYQFEVMGGDDSTLTSKTLTIYLGNFDFFQFDSPLQAGWVGNVKIVRRFTDFSPYVFYEMNYIYAPGELFIKSHKSLDFG